MRISGPRNYGDISWTNTITDNAFEFDAPASPKSFDAAVALPHMGNVDVKV